MPNRKVSETKERGREQEQKGRGTSEHRWMLISLHRGSQSLFVPFLFLRLVRRAAALDFPLAQVDCGGERKSAARCPKRQTNVDTSAK